MKIRTALRTTLFVLLCFSGYAQRPTTINSKLDLAQAKAMAEDHYNKLSLDEKIGQLYMVAAYSGGKNYNESQILGLIQKEKIGGLIFMQGSIPSQIALTNKYQSLSNTPLLISMDAEWGVGMRMKEVADFAKNIELGATNDTELAYKLGRAIADQCKRIGVHINFGPVVDINNNPQNPVINFRSFGEDKYRVSNLGWAYAQGMQDNRVMANAKHFPGHGDTDVDSHKDLPAIYKKYEDLWENELFPYRQMIPKGIASIMIAHLMVPSVTNSNSLPTTLSYDCVTGLLRDKLGFDGLVFTDALNMQGVAKYYSPGDIDLKAFQAGADVLLFSQNVASGKSKIKAAINNGSITEARLKESVIRILTAKYVYGAFDRKNITVSNAVSDLNRFQSTLNPEIARAAVTVVKDDNQVIFSSNRPRILYLILGSSKLPQSLMKNKGATVIDLSSNSTESQLAAYLRTWEPQYDKIIVGIHGVNKYPKGSYGLSSNLRRAANYLATHSKKTAILVNGNPYALKYFCSAPSIMVNYEETDYNMNASMNILNGNATPMGTLPVTACSAFKVGDGIVVAKPTQDIQNTNRNTKEVKKKSATKTRTLRIDPSNRSSAYNRIPIWDLSHQVSSGDFLKNNFAILEGENATQAFSPTPIQALAQDFFLANKNFEDPKRRHNIKRQIVESSITIVQDKNRNLAKGSSAGKILYIYIGKLGVPKSTITNMGVHAESISMRANYSVLNNYLKKWNGYDKILVAIHGADLSQEDFGLNQNQINIANFLASNSEKVSLLLYGKEDLLKFFCDAPSIILNYSESRESVEAAIDVARGNLETRGHIKSSPCNQITSGSGITYKSGIVNTESKAKPVEQSTDVEVTDNYPEENLPVVTMGYREVDDKNYNFGALDQIANTSIAQGVFPGCQILVSRKGQVVYSKSFGKTIYNGRGTITNDMVYDIASVTKIAATTLAVMKLYDDGRINLDAGLASYLPWTKGTNKSSVTIRELLLHQGGLKSWIPFYKHSIEDGQYIPGVYTKDKNINHNIPVARNLYIQTSYPDTIWKEVLESPVGSHRYVYSDLDFMFLQKVVEALTGMSLDKYVERTFYKPLALDHIGYNPAINNWISISKVVPTEKDDYFRHQLLQGYVHDPGAAMLGGVAGHAGVFSSSYDLYVLLQMLNNGGKYRGRQYINPNTVKMFTSYGSSISRRGLGFDKPDKKRPGGPTGDRCSNATFGHQGFTGTCVWADPQNDVIFVFLSNRVYPTQENKKISRYDVRTRLQDEAYKAMGL